MTAAPHALGDILGEARRHWVDGSGKIVAAVALGWLLSMGVRLVYPVLLPQLRLSYGLDLTLAGLLLTVLWIAYAIGQLPSGVLADMLGGGTLMVLSTITAAAMLAIVVVGNTAILLYLATGLFGFATSLYAVGRYAVLSDVFPQRLGTAVGLTAAAGDVGNMLLPPIAGFAAAALSWQLGFGVTIPLFLLAAVALWVTVPRRTSPRSGSETLTSAGFRRLIEELNRPTILLIGVFQVLATAVWQVFTGFYPTYLIEIKGVTAGPASIVFAMFFAVGIVVKPTAGSAYDRIGVRSTLVLVNGISGVALVLVAFVDSFWGLVLLTLPLSTMLGRGTVALSYLTESLADDLQNTGFGTLRTGYLLLSSTSPTLFGIMADRGFFDEIFVILAILSGVLVVIAIRLPERPARVK